MEVNLNHGYTNNIILKKKSMEEKLEKGTIIEVKVPNVENPIKALVLDTIVCESVDTGESLMLICYAQKRLFKVSCRYYERYHKYNGHYRYDYEGIITDYCEIPDTPLDV